MPSRHRTILSQRKADTPGDGKRNLVLVHTETCQERRDFEEIAALVEKQAPNIAVTIVSNDWPFPGIERQLANRPTLIFSPVLLTKFKPQRGRAYFGRSLSKMQEFEAMRAAKIPVPHCELLMPGFEPDPKLFGPFALVKPSEGDASFGRGVQLMRTSRLRYIAPKDYPQDHPGRHHPMIAQRFIDTGPRPSHNRVLTLFGEPLYTAVFELHQARAPLDASDQDLESSVVASNGGSRTRTLTIVDQDMIDLAKRVYRAVPGLPLQGVDIVRDPAGKLWVLEFNSTGNAWHFSSKHGLDMRVAFAAAAGATKDLSETGRKMLIDQFDGFATAARLLAHRTNTEAI